MSEIVCNAASAEWKRMRRSGVTATDIGVILGLSPYESEYSLYLRKRGLIPDDADNSDRLRLGRVLEPYVLQRWQENTAGILISRGTLWRSAERPWQMATVDALTEGNIPVEAKTWADADRWHWDAGPPSRIRVQTVWQADTMGVRRAEVAVVFLPSGEYRRYPVRAEYDEITDLRDAGRAFLNRVDSGIPPGIDGSIATLSALRALYREPVLTSAEVDPQVWEHFTRWRLLTREAESQARYAEALLREQIGNARGILVDGKRVGTHVTGARDYLKIRKDKP